MKIKASRKLIPAIAMLVISAIVLSSASYAWFTMSRTVTATGMNLTAVAPTNLLISNAVGGEYGETTTIAANPTGKLIPASTTNGLNFFAPTAIKNAQAGAPDATTNFVAANTKVGDTDGSYVDYDLWFKTTGDYDVDVTVSQALTTLVDETKTGISGAVRFAILNADGTALAITGKNNIYTFASATDSKLLGAQEMFKVGETAVNPIAEAGTGKHMGTAITVNAANELFTVAKGETPTKITVRVWIEGQAAACVTANAKQSFSMTLGFKDTEYTDVV